VQSRGRNLCNGRQYHHYKEERLVSPNHYYSKDIATASSQPTDPVCPNTNHIQSILTELATVQRLQDSHRVSLESAKDQSNKTIERLVSVENSIHFIGLQTAVTTLVTLAMFIRGG